MLDYPDPRKCQFPTTRWSELGRLDSPEFSQAISNLCVTYWYPVYAFIRRRCPDPDRAEDLTQDFFYKVLDKQTFRAANPEKGRFRSFLLASIRNFLTDEHVARKAAKRGGGIQTVSIDFVAAEQYYLRNRLDNGRPEDDFDRAWALALLERAINRLRDRFEAKGQLDRFTEFVPMLRSETLDYPAIAAAIRMDEPAVRKAASRFRQRFGEFLREEIAQTLSQDGDLDEEVNWMLALFSR